MIFCRIQGNTLKFVCVEKKNQSILIDLAEKTTITTFFLKTNLNNFDFEVLEQKLTRGDTLPTQGVFRFVI